MGDLDKKYIRKHITKAYELARTAHHGQFRKSGEPYISHPVESAMISLSIKPDLVTIESCLLHDVIIKWLILRIFINLNKKKKYKINKFLLKF